MISPKSMNELVDEIKRDEGAVVENGRHVAYADSEGYWTIGVGRLIDSKLPGAGLRDSEVEQMLQNDLSECVEDCQKTFAWFNDLPDLAKKALVNMRFNVGMPRLKKFEKMLNALETGQFEWAAEECLDSRWSRQVGARSERIAELYRSCAT